MSPFILHTHTLFDAGRSSNDTTPPVSDSQPPATMAERVVFILCIVFGSLLVCVLSGLAIYCARRRKHKNRSTATLTLRREASFQAGVPSVIDIIPPSQPTPARRPSAGRTRTASPPPRIVIPSPELGSIFLFDSVSNMMRRGSSARSTQRLSTGSAPRSSSTPTPVPMPKPTSPRHQSLFSMGSTLVGPASPHDKYDMPLRVINPSPLTPLNTNTSQLSKPNPIYRGIPSPSRERLVTSTASADSLASTPPLSPEATWSQQGTFTAGSPTDVIPPGASVAVRKTLSQQSMSSMASSPPMAVECLEQSPYLVGLEYTPFVPPVTRQASSPPLGQCRSGDEVLHAPAALGTPVTLSHFPFRFSATGPGSPGLPPVGFGSPAPSANVGAHNPPTSHSLLSVPSAQRHGLGFLNNGSSRSLSHSTSALKLKIRHTASDEIVAIAFAPRTINFRAVCDAVHARLGFQPQRVWSEDGPDKHVAIVDDASLWSWLDEQYTKGHTRLILQVE